MSLSPQRKKEWIAPTLTVSLLHFFIWWKRNYDRCDNKGSSRPCLDEALLSSLLPPPLLSLSSNPLWSHLLSLSSALHPTPSPRHPPALSLAAWCHLLVLLLRSSLGPLRYNQGTELKIRVSLSERHPGWCTLMSPWKFEIHMLSHFILVPLTPHSLTFLLLFSPLLCLLHQMSSCTILLEREKWIGWMLNVFRKGCESPFLSFIFYVFTL